MLKLLDQALFADTIFACARPSIFSVPQRVALLSRLVDGLEILHSQGLAERSSAKQRLGGIIVAARQTLREWVPDNDDQFVHIVHQLGIVLEVRHLSLRHQNHTAECLH